MAVNNEWRDKQLMGLTGSYGSKGIPGLLFVVPSVCRPKSHGNTGTRLDDTEPPGIYLQGNMPSGGPVLTPKHRERRLTKEEALAYARNFDWIAQPQPYEGPGEMFARGRPEGFFPAGWEELIEAWYECLGRKLDEAIEQSDERRAVLREARAAITGSVSDG